MSDTLEATIGAVYLDGGFEKAREYINRHILNDIEKKKVAIVAYGCNKTRLVPLEQLKIIRKVEENET